jgi:hypothetical protein
VGSAGRHAQRTARRSAHQTAIGIEHLEQRPEIVLVGAAAVKEDQRPCGIAGRRPHPMLEQVGVAHL